MAYTETIQPALISPVPTGSFDDLKAEVAAAADKARHGLAVYANREGRLFSELLRRGVASGNFDALQKAFPNPTGATSPYQWGKWSNNEVSTEDIMSPLTNLKLVD